MKKCKYCGKQKDRLGMYCSKCVKKINERTRNIKRKYNKENLCRECGKPAALGQTRCKECARKHREYRNGYDPRELKKDLINLAKEVSKNENTGNRNTK